MSDTPKLEVYDYRTLTLWPDGSFTATVNGQEVDPDFLYADEDDE